MRYGVSSERSLEFELSVTLPECTDAPACTDTSVPAHAQGPRPTRTGGPGPLSAT